jgi:hypothetical protein
MPGAAAQLGRSAAEQKGYKCTAPFLTSIAHKDVDHRIEVCFARKRRKLLTRG